MQTDSRRRGWAGFALATLVSLVSPVAGQEFHAEFDAATENEGPVLVFTDGFESGGNCNWTSTEPCTTFIVTIPLGADVGDHGFPAQIFLQVGTVLHIVNGDTTPHRIHASGSTGGAVGLPHQQVDMGQGEEYVGTVTQSGVDVLFCHNHGTGSGTMTVQVP